MENIGGALAFKATLDIDDFKVSSEAMGRYIKNASDNAVLEANRMEQSFLTFAQNGARYIVSYLVGQGMMSLVQSIVQVRGQFQQLELAFNTMLRSTEKSQVLMSQLVDTAARTPFDLTSIAQGAKQMLAFGSNVESVVDEIVMLGNVASGVSAPLGDLIYLYGTLRSQGRAYTVDIRQFAGRGIPIYEELGKVLNVDRQELNKLVTEGKVGFPEVEKAFKNMTSEGGIYFNLMQEQSKSLTGMLSNLGDAWDSALNKIGQDNQDLFTGAIQGAIDLVENMDQIIRIVQAVAVAYGTYRAALALQTLQTKKYTGIAFLDNTYRQAKIALLKADNTLSGQSAAITKKMEEAEKAHVAALQSKITLEQHEEALQKIRINAVNQLLNAEQKRYLNNLELTTSSKDYLKEAESILTVEQKQALAKTDLTTKGRNYADAIAVIVKNNEKHVKALQNESKALDSTIQNLEARRKAALEQEEWRRHELAYTRKGNNERAIENAQRQLNAAQMRTQSVTAEISAASARKEAIAKELATIATRQNTAAGQTDIVTKTTQAATTNLLTLATNKLKVAFATLWQSMKANPIGWIGTALSMLIGTVMMFRKEEEQTTTANMEFEDSTKKQVDSLNTLFTVLKNTEQGTRTHKDALDKINAICKEYNKTLLEENSTLEAQTKKYGELTAAIKSNTAEKIYAKYIEKADIEMAEKQAEALEKLKKAAKGASYKDVKLTPTTTPEGVTINAYRSVDVDARNIQKASGQVWENVQRMAMDAREKLKGLTGEAYTETFNSILENITRTVAESTNATGKEMDAFKGKLSEYLTSFINIANAGAGVIEQLENERKAFELPKEAADSVDYVSMSFEELDKKIQETQTQIDTLNAKKVKVEADTTELQSLKKLMDELTGARDTKTDNLNTESGINERIKQLKEERSNVVINSAKYKELTKTINGLEARLPKTSTKQANNADPLRDKQLEADRKLEEARISIMEDGYEKRKALLDLQHKENLDRIDREERELEKARKAAGKGGLTATEQEGFDERRSIENTSYQREQNKLFDGEIAYKKQQYELYFRWVRNLGEDVANTQFANLLKGGASFKQYLENQIAEMNQKKQAGTLTEGEGNHLISLNMQYDEITGAKSAMDLFKESIVQAIDEASNLSEKLDAIAEAKEKLEQGDFHLTQDETAAAELELSERFADVQEEINERILNDFKSYEERKNDIMADYNALRLSETVRNNEELLAKINQGEADALSAIDAEQLKASEDWRNLFTNLDVLSASEISKLIANIEKQMASGDLKLNPVDYQALMDSLNEAKNKVAELNPFKAMGTAFDNYIDATRKLKNAEKENLSSDQINALKKAVQTAAEQMVKSIEQINQMLTSVGSSFSSLASSFGNDDLAETISGVTDVLGGAGQTAMGVGKIMSGDLLGGITGVIGGITGVIGAFNKMHDKKNEKRIQAMQDQVDDLADAYENLGDEIGRAYSTNKAGMLEQQNENLRQTNELIRKQIQEEKDKKDTDWDRIKEWEDQIAENEKQIAENTKYNMIEAIMGTDIASAIDDFATAYADAWAAGEKAASKSANVVKNLIKTAIIDQLKNKLQPEVQKLMGIMADAMDDGIINAWEEDQIDAFVKRLENISDDYLSKNEKWLKDEETKEETEDPLTGAVRSMSEETGGVIAGRLNAFIINQSDQIAIMKQNLVYQAEIAANTSYCKRLDEIADSLKRIENSGNSLLSQGIS